MSVCTIPGLNLRIIPQHMPAPHMPMTAKQDMGIAILAGGCFWCTEAVFTQLAGVLRVTPGYAGGCAEQANYSAVCRGVSGHAEAIRIDYDPMVISYAILLQVFFAVAHDATALNRQGHDIGKQYRSAIFPQDLMQEQMARAYLKELAAAEVFLAPIVTTIETDCVFYPAEHNHVDYAARNPDQPYIRAVSTPKAERLQKYFPGLLKPLG